MKIQEKPKEEQKRSIPSELIMDILCRTPARSVMRFRCVSKFWYSLTHDPYFINMHISHAEKLPPALLVEEQYWKDSDFHSRLHLHSLVDNSKFDNPKAFATIENKNGRGRPSCPCNGLVCFNGDASVEVINLTTQESITILKSTRSIGITHDTIDLTFHPSTKEYKLVRFYYTKYITSSVPNCIFEVLTLGSDSWRLMGDGQPRFIILCDVVCVNGAMYFLCMEGFGERSRLISLDLGDEKFKPVKLPPCCEEHPHRCRRSLHVLNGNLCLRVWGDVFMDIRVLKDPVEQCWSKDYRIVESETSLDNSGFVTVYGQEALLSYRRRELWCCHLGNRSSRVLFKFEKIDGNGLICTYVETLVSLDKFKK